MKNKFPAICIICHKPVVPKEGIVNKKKGTPNWNVRHKDCWYEDLKAVPYSIK